MPTDQLNFGPSQPINLGTTAATSAPSLAPAKMSIVVLARENGTLIKEEFANLDLLNCRKAEDGSFVFVARPPKLTFVNDPNAYRHTVSTLADLTNGDR